MEAFLDLFGNTSEFDKIKVIKLHQRRRFTSFETVLCHTADRTTGTVLEDQLMFLRRTVDDILNGFVLGYFIPVHQELACWVDVVLFATEGQPNFLLPPQPVNNAIATITSAPVKNILLILWVFMFCKDNI